MKVMEAGTKRDYAGIGSCVVGAIAAAVIVVGVLAYRGADHKLAELEWIVIGPGVLVLNLVGVCLAIAALRRRTDDSWAIPGMLLNCSPLLYVMGAILMHLLNG
jgi:hypothetical protein